MSGENPSLTSVIEANEPAFLRKLRSEHGGGDASRHERPLARPRKQMKDEDNHDQPTYVVEDSQDVLSNAEYEALAKQHGREKQDEEIKTRLNSTAEGDERDKESQRLVQEDEPSKEKVAAIGAAPKKRLARVIGDEDSETPLSENIQSSEHDKGRKVKKGKRIKLSFDVE